MKKRVLVAGLWHETNTFVERPTLLHDFDILRGDEVADATDDASPAAGVFEAGEAMNWDILPLLDVRAMPGGIVEDAVIETFWQEFEAAARREVARGVDGIYLVLHGAMVSSSMPDVEGEILARIHELDGFEDVPVCGVIDLHANFTSRMAGHSTGLIAYRENPHTDAKAAAIQAAHLLDRLMRTEQRPVTVWEHPPLLWPPVATDTAAEPMRSLEALAREIERDDEDILAVNVCAGFALADIPEAGVSFTAITVGGPQQARAELRRLSETAMKLRESGNVTDAPCDEVMRRLRRHSEGPVLLVEPADNIGAGAPGDGTGVLRALVKHHVENAAIVINDPEAVAVAQEKRPGERFRLNIGGKGSSLGQGPVPLDVKLVSTSNGRFELEDPLSHLASMAGRHIDMGPCAVVEHDEIRILLTSRKTPPFDLGQLRSQGIEPEKLFAIGVKAAVAHRRAYGPIAKASYTVDTHGPCSSNLRSLPYRNVNRPVYPLDDLPD
jgi:microcystin degradation protein MlrC